MSEGVTVTFPRAIAVEVMKTCKDFAEVLRYGLIRDTLPEGANREHVELRRKQLSDAAALLDGAIYRGE